MTTKVKSSATSRKSSAKSVNNAAVAAGVSSSAVAAVAAAGVTGSATSSERAKAINAGLAAPVAVPAGRASVVASAVMDDTEMKLIDLRTRISSRWTAPRFEDSEEFAIMSAALAAVPADLRERSLNGARLAWLARPENAALTPSLAEVCEYISTNFAKEFRQLCGCSCPAAAAVRVYSYTNLSVSTITADSDINDYLFSSAVPAGLSAAGLVSAVMSVRVLVDIKRRFAAARAAARNEFKDCMASAARRALRLGVSPAVAARYFSYLLNAVPVADASEEKKLRKNLSGCWTSLRKIENAIVLAGGRGALADGCGGWCFPAAGLAAVLPAGASASAAVRASKVRKLWAKRVRVLSSIATLETLLSRC